MCERTACGEELSLSAEVVPGHSGLPTLPTLGGSKRGLQVVFGGLGLGILQKIVKKLVGICG